MITDRLRPFPRLPPHVLTTSLRLSRRHGASSPVDLPIIAAPHSTVECGDGGRLELGGQLFLGFSPRHPEPRRRGDRGPAILVGGANSRFATDGWVYVAHGCRVTVSDGATAHVGEGAFLNRDVNIIARNHVSIGRRCAIGWESLIMDSDFHALIVDGDALPPDAPIVIEDDVWLGARCTVLKGVTIGQGAVIGAGSIVTRDVPPRCVAAGSPARAVRKDIDGWV